MRALSVFLGALVLGCTGLGEPDAPTPSIPPTPKVVGEEPPPEASTPSADAPAWAGPAAPVGEQPNLASFAHGARPIRARHAFETPLEVGGLLDDWLRSHWANRAEDTAPMEAVIELGTRSRIQTIELAIHGDAHYEGLANAPSRVDVSIGDGPDGPWRAAWSWTPARDFDVGVRALAAPMEGTHVKLDIPGRQGGDFGTYLSHLGLRGEPVGASPTFSTPAGVYHGGWLLGQYEISARDGRLTGCFSDTGRPIDVAVDGRAMSLRWTEDSGRRVSAIVVPLLDHHLTGTIQGFYPDGAQDDVAIVSVERYADTPRQCSAKAAKVEPPNLVEAALERDGRARVHSILFDFGSDRLRPESGAVLDEIAEALRRHPEWKLLVEGHTDSVGSDAKNLDLSKRRAAATITALVSRGVDVGRLRSEGHGESRPAASNDTPNGRAENRRVELIRE